MTLSFSDIHNAILEEAKEAIPFPFQLNKKAAKVKIKKAKHRAPKIKPPKIVKTSNSEKVRKTRLNRGLSTEKIKDLVLSRKKVGCSICGYSKCMAALEFHHVNPSEKSFAISKAHSGYSLDEILKELSKCILVCSNCHKEIHAGIIELK